MLRKQKAPRDSRGTGEDSFPRYDVAAPFPKAWYRADCRRRLAIGGGRTGWVPRGRLGSSGIYPIVTGGAVEVAPIRDLDRLEAVGNAINSRIPRKSICC
jgi:hypothetical protein